MFVAAEFSFQLSSSGDRMTLGKCVLLGPRMKSHFVNSAILSTTAVIHHNFDTGPAV